MWVYRILPNGFSPETISYLKSLGSFTDGNKIQSNSQGVLFAAQGNAKNLSITFKVGAVEFHNFGHYGPTNLAKNVPPMSALPSLMTNFAGKMGINIQEIAKQGDGTPDFHCSESATEYFANRAFITNVTFRAVSFRRNVDGADWVGNNTGGDCRVEFGENGRPTAIALSWRNLEPYKMYPTATSDQIVDWVRKGRAVQNMIPMDAESIDWKSVKSLTVTKAEVCYYAGGPFEPSNWLVPFVALWTTVNRGHETIDVEIDCPIIDEGKL